MDVNEFFSFVTEEIHKKAPAYFKENPPEKMTYESFLKLIVDLHEEGKKIILALDEFDIVTDNENFDLEFFSFLRSMANFYNVAYITSSRKDFQQLSREERIKGSPFFNIFIRIGLGLFEKESALRLIRDPSKRAGVPLETYTNFIVELAGFHPFFIQIACFYLFKHLKDPDSHGIMDEKGRQKVMDKFYSDAEDHFRYMWDHLEDKEKMCLETIARLEELSRRLQVTAGKLEKRGFLVKEGLTYKIFSDSFRDFVWREAEEEKYER